jgi:hypothetical protein
MKEIIRENLLLFYVYWAIIILFIYSRIVLRKSDRVVIHEDNKSQKMDIEDASEWWWIIKKTKLYRIEEVQHKWDNDSVLYSEYWLFTQDPQWNKYMSERFRDIEYHPWRRLDEMKVSYKWTIYDLSKTEQSIKQIHWNIARLETELAAKPDYWKRLELEKELRKMKEFLSMINEWPSSSYVVINWKRFTIWDIINVFIDPNSSNNYYLDI